MSDAVLHKSAAPKAVSKSESYDTPIVPESLTCDLTGRKAKEDGKLSVFSMQSIQKDKGSKIEKSLHFIQTPNLMLKIYEPTPVEGKEEKQLS